jgi:hypothetical protein
MITGPKNRIKLLISGCGGGTGLAGCRIDRKRVAGLLDRRSETVSLWIGRQSIHSEFKVPGVSIYPLLSLSADKCTLT